MISIVLGALVTFWFNSLSLPGTMDLVMRRPALESIVAQIRQARIPVGAIVRYRCRGSFWLGGLKVQPTSTSSDVPLEERVYAERESTGELTVVIVTRNLGHAGTFGYACSDIRDLSSFLKSSEERPNLPGDIPFLGERISGNWWRAYENRN